MVISCFLCKSTGVTDEGSKEGALTVSALPLVHRTMFFKPPESGFYPVPVPRGQALFILVGGAHEALYDIPGEHFLTLLTQIVNVLSSWQ